MGITAVMGITAQQVASAARHSTLSTQQLAWHRLSIMMCTSLQTRGGVAAASIFCRKAMQGCLCETHSKGVVRLHTQSSLLCFFRRIRFKEELEQQRTHMQHLQSLIAQQQPDDDTAPAVDVGAEDRGQEGLPLQAVVVESCAAVVADA